jgi:hypothetical protein
MLFGQIMIKDGVIMAQENVKLFKEKLASSDELKKRCKELEEAYTGDKQDREAIAKAVLIPLAKEAGIPVTLEEFKAEETKEGCLSDEDLESVSGGEGGFCFIVGAGDGLVCVAYGYNGSDTGCAFFSYTE